MNYQNVPQSTSLERSSMNYWGTKASFTGSQLSHSASIVVKTYRIRPNYRTVHLDFSKLRNKLVVNYQPNKGTL